MKMKNIHLAVIAGGKGTRLFPLSHPACPKQFCMLRDNVTFIQDTVKRFLAIGLHASRVIVVVTNERQAELAKAQLFPLGVLSPNIITIPDYYGYAGAMVAAAEFIYNFDPEAVVINTPSDQAVVGKGFQTAVKSAIRNASVGTPTIVGVKINDLNTFIGCGHATYCANEKGVLHQVTGFIEKPDKDIAYKLMRAGNTACNTGINAWRAKDLLRQVTTAELDQLGHEFPTNQLMDRFECIDLYVGSFQWHDCGTLKSFYDISKKTPNHHNASIGGLVHRTDCRDSLFITCPGIELYVTGFRNAAVVANFIDGEPYVAVVALSESQYVRDLAEDYEKHKDLLDYCFTRKSNNFEMLHTNISKESKYGIFGKDDIGIAVVKDFDGKIIVVASENNKDSRRVA